MADDSDNYKAGPGRPPLRTRFPKGQSGNPGGRSKKKLHALLADALNEPMFATIVEMFDALLSLALGRLCLIIVIPGAEKKRGSPEPMNTGLWKMGSGLAAFGDAPERR